MKRLLIPKQIYSCNQCIHRWYVTVGDKGYYLCGLAEVEPHESDIIPNDCPLEDWKE